MKIKYKKRRGAVILQTFAAFSFLALTPLFDAHSSTEFNAEYFKNQALAFHLRDKRVKEAYNSIVDLRNDINTYIEYDHEIFMLYIDKICTNIVGNTMMKLLIANIKVNPKKKLEIVQVYGKDGNVFNHNENKVCINLDLYGNGIKKNSQCGIDENGELVERKSYIAEGLFHELGHAFHYQTNTRQTSHLALDYLYKNENKYLWTTEKHQKDEELYNITGRFYNGSYLDFDPINCNLFDICNSCKLSKPIIQRMFHKCFYIDDKKTKKQQCIKDLYKEVNILEHIDKLLIDTSLYVIN